MQFKTKLGLVDIPNEEVLRAADEIRGPVPGARVNVEMALRCLEELEDAAMHNKARRVPNFNENNERRSQISAARVALDIALARLG